MAELALADSNTLKVEEIYLIRRGTGELVGRWPQAEQHNRSQVMSGVLAAINEFASDAFGNDGSSLRQIDMGDACVYLRASPLYLLAARCTGAAPANAERLLDDVLLSTIERCQTLTTSAPAAGEQRPPAVSEPTEPAHRTSSRLASVVYRPANAGRPYRLRSSCWD